ncbi:hypothetical protein ACRAWD_18855 [Caulobacter segnis]
MDKGEAVVPSNDKVRIYHNVNAETGSHLYVVVHNPSSATGDEAFTFKVKTRDGEYVVPSRIKGQDSKMLMASYDLGGQRLVYSTSEIQTHLKWNDGDLALLYGRAGEAWRDGAALCVRAEGRGAGGRCGVGLRRGQGRPEADLCP